MLTVTVTSASAGEKKYTDDFYSCRGGNGTTYVTNVDGVFHAMRALAQ